jgi:hypothetical protein
MSPADSEIVDGETGELVPYAPAPPTLFGTSDPVQVVAQASKNADALAAVIRDKHLYKTIGGKNHVFVEAWTLLGTMVGVFPSVVWTKPLENGGWEARVEARTLAGDLVGAAEAQCGRDEPTWAKRPDYALRSMAQTRATSRALRGPLGFIVVLAGYSATAAEEMQDVQQGPNPSATGNDTKKATQPQIARMMTLAGELDKKGVAPPDEHAEWGDYIVHYIKERWGHDSRKDLTRGQIEHLMAHLEEGCPF